MIRRIGPWPPKWAASNSPGIGSAAPASAAGEGEAPDRRMADAYARNEAALRAYADLAAGGAAEAPSAAEHLMAALARRARRTRTALGLRRAAAAAALLVTGALAGSYGPGLLETRPVSYAVAVEGSHLILASDAFQAVRRVSDADVQSRGDRLISGWLRRPARAPRIPGYTLQDVELLRADSLPVAGLLYRSDAGRLLTVSLAPDDDGRPDPRVILAAQGRRATYWSDGRDSYGVLEGRL